MTLFRVNASKLAAANLFACRRFVRFLEGHVETLLETYLTPSEFRSDDGKERMYVGERPG